MNQPQMRAKIRQEAEEAGTGLASEEARAAQTLRRNCVGAAILGALTIAASVSIRRRMPAPYSQLGLIAVLLGTAFLLTAVLAFASWIVVRRLKKTNVPLKARLDR